MTSQNIIVIHTAAAQQMKERGGTWAAYQNQAFDSSNHGHMQFLKVGDDCTYRKPPISYPADTIHGMGWRYIFVGMCDFENMKVGENLLQIEDDTEPKPSPPKKKRVGIPKMSQKGKR